MYNLKIDKVSFDKVSFSALFDLLIERKIPWIYLRCMLFIYLNQQAQVNWSNQLSNKFDISNGIRQGAIMSPALFSIYLDELVISLRKSGVGCSIERYYYGILCYADDIIALCPTMIGLEKMMEICEKYGEKFNISFSVNIDEPKKSKCKTMIFSRDGKTKPTSDIKLKGVSLPWTRSIKHLGHLLSNNCSTDNDLIAKKCSFISRCHNILQEFHFVHPETKMALIQTYCLSFYSSQLWDLYGKEANKLYNQWNVLVRAMWDVPRETHRNLIEPLSETTHIKNILLARSVSFAIT